MGRTVSKPLALVQETESAYQAKIAGELERYAGVVQVRTPRDCVVDR